MLLEDYLSTFVDSMSFIINGVEYHNIVDIPFRFMTMEVKKARIEKHKVYIDL